MRMDRRELMRRAVTASFALPAVYSSGTVAGASTNGPRERIKIGQIGTTHSHAAGKLTAMRKLNELYELVGVVEPDMQRRQRLQENAAYRGVTWLTEAQLLETAGLQAVAVETAVRDLVPTAARCVRAGMHVHLDKPPGESLGTFRGMLDQATRSGRVVQMGYMFRYNPAFQFLFRAIRSGWLGQIFEVHGVISKTVGPDARRQLAEYPGGTMFELGCHLIDALVIVMGEPDQVHPFVRATRPDQDHLADNQLAVFEYPKATATVRSALMEVDGFRRRQFVVCGDEGTVEIQPLEPPRLLLTLARPRDSFVRGTQEIALPRATGRYDDEFRHLARIIRGDQRPEYGPEHDLAVHETVLRASGVPWDG